MNYLEPDQLKAGILTWYTVPEALGFGRVVVCDMLCSNNLIITDNRIISETEYNTLSRDPVRLGFYMVGLVTVITNRFNKRKVTL